jgi:hypothetical protein
MEGAYVECWVCFLMSWGDYNWSILSGSWTGLLVEFMSWSVGFSPVCWALKGCYYELLSVSPVPTKLPEYLVKPISLTLCMGRDMVGILGTVPQGWRIWVLALLSFPLWKKSQAQRPLAAFSCMRVIWVKWNFSSYPLQHIYFWTFFFFTKVLEPFSWTLGLPWRHCHLWWLIKSGFLWRPRGWNLLFCHLVDIHELYFLSLVVINFFFKYWIQSLRIYMVLYIYILIFKKTHLWTFRKVTLEQCNLYPWSYFLYFGLTAHLLGADFDSEDLGYSLKFCIF